MTTNWRNTCVTSPYSKLPRNLPTTEVPSLNFALNFVKGVNGIKLLSGVVRKIMPTCSTPL